jgi:hypothetical protein
LKAGTPPLITALTTSGSMQEPDEHFFVPDQEHFLHPATALDPPQKLSFIALTDSGIFNL